MSEGPLGGVLEKEAKLAGGGRPRGPDCGAGLQRCGEHGYFKREDRYSCHGIKLILLEKQY